MTERVIMRYKHENGMILPDDNGPYAYYTDYLALLKSAEALARALEAAYHALKSYQYGNDSTELAEECAEQADAALKAWRKQ